MIRHNEFAMGPAERMANLIGKSQAALSERERYKD
jgi:hypothetical protein